METIDRIFDLADKVFKEQKDFAAALGVSTTMVSAWRTGTSQSYKKRIPQIAEVLNTTASYLLGEKEKPATVTGDGQVAKLAAALISHGVDIENIPASRLDQIARLIKVHLDE